MSISSTTRTLGVIGWPVGRSRSRRPCTTPPCATSAWAGSTCLSLSARSTSPRAVGGVRGLGLVGLNVTIPHKAAGPYLDDAMPEVWLNACNTIINDDGHLRGENTDVPGFRRSVAEALAGPWPGGRWW